MSKKSFDSLNKKQQKALMAAGKVAEKYMTKEAAGLDTTMEKAYKKAGVKLAYMTQKDFDAWLAIAKKSSYKNFAEKVPGGQKLIDQALAVK
jgi:TRAP-type C4-dicarboxylate transport system substrate-binding protein